MIGFVVFTAALLLWLLWDEIHDVRPARRSPAGPRVTIVGEHRYADLDDFLATLQAGDVIVSQNGTEIPVAADWTPGDIMALLAEVESL